MKKIMSLLMMMVKRKNKMSDHQLTEYMTSTNNWSYVNEKVITSRIYRFDYKGLLGESLTAYITKRKDLTNEQIIKEVMSLETTQWMLNVHPHLRGKFMDNLRTSISSRRAEQSSYNKRQNENNIKK